MARNEEGGDLWDGYNYTGDRGDPVPFDIKTSCPADVWDNASPDLRVPQLPWRLQDDWGCERERQNISVLVLENDFLRAEIVPQWGGKIWSLYHKIHKRHMFFDNPAHQPSNIGYRKAWASGGCEWNWAPGHIGHSVFTESPVYAAVLETKKGPLVRVYEYDRQNSTVWQVDIMLDGETLLAHPKITNPTERDQRGYWWTCVAMSVDGPRNRVLGPARVSIDNDGQCTPWPWGAFMLPNTTFRGPDIRSCASSNACAFQNDMSFLGNIPEANDFFFHIEKGVKPWIAQVKEDGFTVIHSHPKFLNGTKFFQWGWREQGIYNQDFLSATDTEQPGCSTDAYDPYCIKDHPGLYTELQVGPARTQMHTFPLEANSVLEWTEWFKAWQADAEEMQDPDYSVPLRAVDKWWNGRDGITDAYLEEMDEILKTMADVVPTSEQIVHHGLPWGGLQEKLQRERLGQYSPLAPGCLFLSPEVTAETRPWLELLRTGSFSEETLSRVPVNFEVGDDWIGILDESIKAGNESWLHYLFLGTHALEVGNVDGARGLLLRSNELKRSAHATRNLALIASTRDAAWQLYQTAWEIWTELDAGADLLVTKLGIDLSGEISGWLLGNKLWDDLENFLVSLQKSDTARSFLQKDRALHAQAAVAVNKGDFETALLILRNNCFPTYGSRRIDLLSLWWEANKQQSIDANKGEELTLDQILDLRKRLRCDGDQSHRTIDHPCICGPPNLGYPYG